ncbi:hypothetical protein P4U65_15265 [Bacillus pacificus]|nr:hypothetical protein [Bacillus pacificus]
MSINVHKALFRIRPYKNAFAILVKYEDRIFLAEEGSLAHLKPKFIQIVKNRECLRPFLERALSISAASFENAMTPEEERKLALA